MKAAWYEKQGPAKDVLVVGEMPDPHAGAGEVRIRLAASGINPGDIKKRQDFFHLGMSYPRVIPHSDGAGIVDEVGDGVAASWIGKPVWCFGAQSYRPFGTAAEFTAVPLTNIALLPKGVSMNQGACLGIPGITAHRAVHVAGPVAGRTIFVQGAAGGVGICAVQLARYAGATVVGSVRSLEDVAVAQEAGAHHTLLNDERLKSEIETLAPKGIDHIVEVAFAANIQTDVELLKEGGSIASYATNLDNPQIPFWPMLFKNVRLFFLGSDNFPPDAKTEAAKDLNAALSNGWPGFPIAEVLPLDEIVFAHEAMERPSKPGRVVLEISAA